MAKKHAPVDQRQVIYTAYVLQIEDHDQYRIFKTSDVADAIGVSRSLASGVINKAIDAKLIRMVKKEGVVGLYTLTASGLKRGEYHMEHYNIMTGEMS